MLLLCCYPQQDIWFILLKHNKIIYLFALFLVGVLLCVWLLFFYNHLYIKNNNLRLWIISFDPPTFMELFVNLFDTTTLFLLSCNNSESITKVCRADSTISSLVWKLWPISNHFSSQTLEFLLSSLLSDRHWHLFTGSLQDRLHKSYTERENGWPQYGWPVK